jgi:hypothetical protein
MKKTTLPPVFIVIASAIYFLIASVALAQEPQKEELRDNKLVKYCTSSDNGKTTLVSPDGKQITETVNLENGATVSLDGIITWKDGSKTTLKSGDCVGIDNWGAVYVAKAPATTEKTDTEVSSNR